jgi:3-dehydroquinate synthase
MSVSSFEELLVRLADQVAGARVGIVTDATVDALSGTELVQGPRAGGLDVLKHVLPAGEQSKSRASADELWDWLATIDFERRDVLVAFGGGVVSDLTGWVASAFTCAECRT